MKNILFLAVAFAFTLSGVAYAQKKQGVETPNNHQKASWNIAGFWGGNMSNNNSICYHPYHPHPYGTHCVQHYPPGYGNPGYGGQPHYGTYPGYGQPQPPHGGHYGNYPPNYSGYANYVDHNSLNNFVNALNREAFDDNKLTMALFFAKNSNLRVEQIAQILAQFTFDSSRLKFAKSAYSNCVDKYNYPTLRPHFTFGSNFQNLLNHIG